MSAASPGQGRDSVRAPARPDGYRWVRVSSRDRQDTRTGDSKTDAINRAIQVYSYLAGITETGGTLYVRDAEAMNWSACASSNGL